MAETKKITECEWCGDELDEEETERPQRAGTDVICDDCYHVSSEFTCCWCEEYEHIDYQHKILVVLAPTTGRGPDVLPGFYEIIDSPYWGHCYFDAWLFPDALKRICDLPEEARFDDFYPCGHLCRECQEKVKELVKKAGSHG